jgi:hypothetical protein
MLDTQLTTYTFASGTASMALVIPGAKIAGARSQA